MAKQIEFVRTTDDANESGPGTDNNLYVKKFEKTSSYDEKSNGMGIEKPATLKPFETVPGSLANERDNALMREMARFNDLQSKAFGRDIPITNAGIVLDSYGGAFGETGSPVRRGKGEDSMGEEQY